MCRKGCTDTDSDSYRNIGISVYRYIGIGIALENIVTKKLVNIL